MKVTGVVKVASIESLTNGVVKAMLHEVINNRRKSYGAKFYTDKIKTVKPGTMIELKDAELDKTSLDRICVKIDDFEVVR